MFPIALFSLPIKDTIGYLKPKSDNHIACIYFMLCLCDTDRIKIKNIDIGQEYMVLTFYVERI